VLIAASALSQTNIDWKAIHKDLLRLDSCMEIGHLNDSLMILYIQQLNDCKHAIEVLKQQNQLQQTHIQELDSLALSLTNSLSKVETTINRQKRIIKIFSGSSATLLIIIVLFIAI